MLHYVTGDILNSKAEAIAHGVAPNDNFKQGLALSLRERWPSMYSDFRHWGHQDHPKPGTLWTWSGPGRRVVCLLTQEGGFDHGSKPGKASTQHVNHALRELAKAIPAEGFGSLALPRLATGVGGLDWDDVKPLIEQHLADIEIPIFVYETYQPGVTADEPGL